MAGVPILLQCHPERDEANRLPSAIQPTKTPAVETPNAFLRHILKDANMIYDKRGEVICRQAPAGEYPSLLSG